MSAFRYFQLFVISALSVSAFHSRYYEGAGCSRSAVTYRIDVGNMATTDPTRAVDPILAVVM